MLIFGIRNSEAGMFSRILIALWLAITPVYAGTLPLLGAGGPPPATGDTPFTPLHTFFMAATGCNDANAGTSAGSPWCTPNHAVVCGDVIIAAAGDYSTTNVGDDWGTVSNCPSTSAGIDGTGGIQFAVVLCGGSDLEACHSSGNLWEINQHHWAVEGFHVTNTGTGSANRAFNSNGCNGFVLHHNAFINNVVVSAASGFHTDDCGTSGSAAGNDYWAAVGNIAQNASQNSDFCEAAIDSVGPGVLDNNAGTHHYIYGNFTWNDQSAGCVSLFDSEGMMFDSWDARTVNYTGVMANNMVWHAMRYCSQVINTGNVTDSPTLKIHNNTCYSNNTNIGPDNADGDINFQFGNVQWTTVVQKNIAQSTVADNKHFALAIGSSSGTPNSNVTIGGSGNENILKGVATGSCPGSSCDAGSAPFSAVAFNSNSLGTNIYTNPTFNNTTDLTTNWLGAPSCTGFINATKCMGYDPATSTLTSNTPIYDLTATCGSCSGKGYQLPSTTCATNADFPTWLKGIVYLHVVSGSTIVQKHDLVTTPCGL